MKMVVFFQMIFFLILTSSANLYAETGVTAKRIVFFSPTSKNNTYWPQVFKVLHAVAKDLKIEIETFEFDVGDRFAKHLEGAKILRKNPKPDGAILSVAFGNSKPLLEVAEEEHIPAFIQGPLFPDELPELGTTPRNKYKQWIGYFYQDEFEKGYILGKTLLKAAHREKAFAEDGKIHVVGIGGDFTWFGSQLRKNGLEQAVNEDPAAKLLQVVSTRWTPSEGLDMTARLLDRYPKVSVVWAASDQLGIGASKALEDAGLVIGKTGFVGGLDLSRNGLEHVQKSKLIATVASSLISYAEIVIFLHDYLHGIDFAGDVGTEIRTALYTATKTNVDLYLSLSDSYDRIDFKKFSKVFNTKLRKYDFSPELLFQSESSKNSPSSSKRLQ